MFKPKHTFHSVVETLIGGLESGRISLPERLEPVEVPLQGSVAWGELWLTISACWQVLNLRTIRLDVNAPVIFEGYHASWQRSQPPPDEATSWRAEIPLVARGQTIGRLQVAGEQDNEPVWQKIATLIKLVQDFELTASQLQAPMRSYIENVQRRVKEEMLQRSRGA